jgi:hypothetical protein
MIDPLGHSITEGATVFTTPYWSTSFSTFAKVKRINKSTVTITLKKYAWDKHKKKFIEYEGEIKRRPSRMIIIDNQLAFSKKLSQSFNYRYIL